MYRLLWLLLFCPSWLFGQQNLLSEGILAYETGAYANSIRTLAALIEAQGALPAYELPKAHFYLSQSYWEAYQQANLRSNYPEALLRAYNHLTAASRLDLTGHYQEMSQLAIEQLLPSMLEGGIAAYNRGDFSLAARYFSRVHQLQPRLFEAHLNEGYAQWQLGDSLKAVNSWQRALDLSPKPTQVVVGEESLISAYAMLIHTYSQWGQVSRARGILAEANQRFMRHPLLREAELDLYLSHPGQLPNGRQHFQDQLRQYPKEEALQVAYARYLYYQQDTAEAMLQFYKIIQNYPNQLVANRFLSAYYLWQARALIDQPAGRLQEGEQKARRDKILDHLLEALPYLKKLHELEPDEKFWLEELVAVTEYIQLPQADSYRKALRQFRN